MDIDRIYRQTGSINGLVLALSMRDPHTQAHCQRVVGLATGLGERLGLTASALEVLALGAGFHDIGKIGIPDTILLKRGELTADERAIMQSHTVKGESIIRAMTGEYFAEIAGVVRHHHEHFDGRGYPDGLVGSSIPLLARILGVVDSYDAMTERRAYRGALPQHIALDRLTDERGAKHDPDILDVFLEMVLPGMTRRH